MIEARMSWPSLPFFLPFVHTNQCMGVLHGLGWDREQNKKTTQVPYVPSSVPFGARTTGCNTLPSMGCFIKWVA
ncbi:hypothetical protein GGR50DRAFT_635230, partial [Xylaria sp. CBS 124048]